MVGSINIVKGKRGKFIRGFKCLQAIVDSELVALQYIKDGAYYCYCAYILRIARYSGFLWVEPINIAIFLRGLKLYGESRTYQMPLVSQKKIGGNHAFFREN